jgi:hypothetical protein
MYAYNSLRGDKNGDDTSDDSTVLSLPRQTRSISYTILGIFRRTLRRILLDESEYIARAPSNVVGDTDDENDQSVGPLVTHQGSCHCESIQFTVLAPHVLCAQDGPGKIQFRHVQVKASNFQVYAGFENLKTYYVAYRDSGNKGAHAFCERCGVHILYAPSKTSPFVSINVRCFRDDPARKIKLTSKKDGISAGVPVAGQFDNVNSDQLSTISEVTQPFHFQMNSNPTIFDRNQVLRPSASLTRKSSDVSSMASPADSDEDGLGVPIKQFYAPSTTTKTHKSRLSTISGATASITEESSGSVYRGTIPDLLPPMSPARSGGASFGGTDEFSFTGGDSVSLIDDSMSLTGSVTQRQSNTITIRGKDHKLNPPRHPTVDANKMKYFMSKYKKKTPK